MKHNFFKTVLMLVLCLVFGTSAAQITVVNNQMANGKKSNSPFKPSIDLSKYNKRVVANGVDFYNLKDNSIRSKKTEAGEYVTVTFKYQYDNTKFEPDGYVAIYDDYTLYPEYFDYDWETDEYRVCVCELPVGTYDICASGLPLVDGNYLFGVANEIIEQVPINQDTTITIDFSDCTNRYELKTYLSNGEEGELDTWDYNENNEVIITSTGNISQAISVISLIRKGGGIVATHFAITDGEHVGWNKSSTLFFNDLSDRYNIAGAIAYFDKDSNCHIAKLESKSTSEHLITHDAGNYLCYEETFAPSLSNNMDNEGVLAVSVDLLYDNMAQREISYGHAPLSDYKLYIDAAWSESSEANQSVEVMVTPRFGDIDKSYVETYTWEDWDGTIVTQVDTIFDFHYINGLPIIVNSNKEVEYVNTGANNNFRITAEGGDLISYPGHPQFSYLKDQKALGYGSNCPINAVMSESTEGLFSAGKATFIYCNYIGRYGEKRDVDLDAVQAEIKYNDEVICNDYGTIYEDMYDFALQGNPDGVITAHFVNSNMMVDGLQGSNVTDIYMNQRHDDWTAPTLQMLLFKDREGNIIDRFETAEEGTLEFAGGDFNFNLDMERYIPWFDCKEQTVEVSYSPYCADQWLPLEVNEIPSEFFMPAFGYFYRGSLQNVTSVSQTGWYDLRIKLTDASGNWQEQVISPAFRIGSGSPTGIETVNSNDATEIARYTVDGRAISAPQAGVNIVKMSDGTVKKVLVK